MPPRGTRPRCAVTLVDTQFLRVLKRPRPLHEPRRILESDAKAYIPAVVAGVAIGVLLLAVLLVFERRQRAAVNPEWEPVSELVLEPASAVSSVPLGEFGACVQARLTETRPDGAETDQDMRAAQDACLTFLGAGPPEAVVDVTNED